MISAHYCSSCLSSHVTTGLAGLGLLALQATLPAFFASQGKSARDVVSQQQRFPILILCHSFSSVLLITGTLTSISS